MIKIRKKRNCCGCGACSQVCPKQCIRMKSDEEGFLYPTVDQENCINCGLCEQSCPISNTQGTITSCKEVFVAQHIDDVVRLSSSSGGAFTALAENVIQNNGVVFGAAFDEDWLLHHIRVESWKNLGKLRGSKYLQSRTEHCYQQTKIALEEGRSVLYSGTGCQIAGLKSYLKKDYWNLLTVDIICHGVPSAKLWKHYLSEQERMFGAPVKNVFFRNKDKGWKNYCLKIEFNNKQYLMTSFRNDPYMRLFLKNICLRPSCYDCRFKTINSQADITVGDCWGIEKTNPEKDDDKGLSVVIVHTDKGENAFKQTSKNLYFFTESYQNVLQRMMYLSVKPHPHRKQFFMSLNRGQKIAEMCDLLEISLTERVINKVKNGFLDSFRF